jgi:hypothetical protein
MPSVETEPRVVASDVAAALRRAGIRDDIPSAGELRAAVAEGAGVSTETLKRIEDGRTKILDLDRADSILVACGGHISECELVD